MMICSESSTFASMFRIFLISMLMTTGLSVTLHAQSNPFDLKFRTPAKKAVAIDRIEEPVIDSSSVSENSESKLSGKSQQPVNIDSDTVALSGAKQDMPLDSSRNNPFEVGASSREDLAISTPKSETTANRIADEKKPGIFTKKTSKGFQIFFVLLSLLFIIFIVNVERSFVRDLWRVISNENYSSLHHRNQRNTMRQILLMMGYAVFIFQAGLFLFFAIQFLGYTDGLLSSLWLCIGFVLGIYLTRHAVIRYLRWLFNNDKEMTLFGFDISIFNTMVGLILLPVNILLIFGPENIYKPLIIIGIIAVLSAYFLRQLRWLLTARHLIAHSLFLFFVYLCAVELLPLWAISKLFW